MIELAFKYCIQQFIQQIFKVVKSVVNFSELKKYSKASIIRNWPFLCPYNIDHLENDNLEND